MPLFTLPSFEADAFAPFIVDLDTQYGEPRDVSKKRIEPLDEYQLPELTALLEPFGNFDDELIYTSDDESAALELPSIQSLSSPSFSIDFDEELSTLSSFVEPEKLLGKLKEVLSSHLIIVDERILEGPNSSEIEFPSQLSTATKQSDTPHVESTNPHALTVPPSIAPDDIKVDEPLDWTHPIAAIRYIFGREPRRSTSDLPDDSTIIGDIHLLFDIPLSEQSSDTALENHNTCTEEDSETSSGSSPLDQDSDDGTVSPKGSPTTSVEENLLQEKDELRNSRPAVVIRVDVNNSEKQWKCGWSWADDVSDEEKIAIVHESERGAPASEKQWKCGFSWADDISDDEDFDGAYDPDMYAPILDASPDTMMHAEASENVAIDLETVQSVDTTSLNTQIESKSNDEESELTNSDQAKDVPLDQPAVEVPWGLSPAYRIFLQDYNEYLLSEIARKVWIMENRCMSSKDLAILEANTIVFHEIIGRIYTILASEEQVPYIRECIAYLSVHHRFSPIARAASTIDELTNKALPKAPYKAPHNARKHHDRHMHRLDRVLESLPWKEEHAGRGPDFEITATIPNVQEVRLFEHPALRYWRCSPSTLRICATSL